MWHKEALDVLNRDGVYVLPHRIDEAQLASMQRQFDRRVSQMTLQRGAGYYMDDPYRKLVDDVLLLDEGFVHVALQRELLQVMTAFVGQGVCLTEAKGWRSMETTRNIHGWHSDAWYSPDLDEVPRQLKLGVYLSDVRSGGLAYLKGSQGQRPCHWSEAQAKAHGGLVHITGQAGTMFLFDPSGMHRQARPVIEQRDAVFFVYHDPEVPLQDADERVYRYHPVQVRVDTLGALNEMQMRVLGVGQKALYRPDWVHQARYPVLDRVVTAMYRGASWLEHGWVTCQYGLRRYLPTR